MGLGQFPHAVDQELHLFFSVEEMERGADSCRVTYLSYDYLVVLPQAKYGRSRLRNLDLPTPVFAMISIEN